MTSKIDRVASRTAGGTAGTNGGSCSSGMSSVAIDMRSPSLEQRPALVDIALREHEARQRLALAQLLEHERADVRRHAVLHLEPHDLAEPPLEDLLLDHRQQVFRLVDCLVELEVGVSRDLERPPAEHLHSREQRPEVRADDFLERHEVIAATERHPARKALRHLHAREVVDAAIGIANLDGEREREVRDVRKRMPRIDRQRRQDRKHLGLEELIDGVPLARRQVGHAHEPDAAAHRAPAAVARADTRAPVRAARAPGARSRRAAACGDSPSAGDDVTPAATCRRSPATRTM